MSDWKILLGCAIELVFSLAFIVGLWEGAKWLIHHIHIF